MRKYIVYNNKGDILKFGVCPTLDVAMQVNTKIGGPGPKYVKVVPTLSRKFDLENKVEEGKVVFKKKGK